MNQKQVALIVEGEEVLAKVRVRTRRDFDARRDSRKAEHREMREERQYA
jgi:hypothetical protein